MHLHLLAWIADFIAMRKGEIQAVRPARMARDYFYRRQIPLREFRAKLLQRLNRQGVVFGQLVDEAVPAVLAEPNRVAREEVFLVDKEILSALNRLIEDRDSVYRDFQKIKRKLYSTDGLEKERTSLEEETNVASGLIDQLITENARKAQDQGEYQRRYDELVSRFETAKTALGKTAEEIERRTLVRETIETFLEDLKRQDSVITKFAPEAFCSLVDHVTVYGAGDIRVTFKNGQEIKA